MWKIIVLSLFVFVQSSDVKHFYGTWTQVAFYPISGYIPACIQFSFQRDSSKAACSCADGKKATLVEVSMIIKEGKETVKAAVDSYPLLVIGSPKDVDLDVECVCGKQLFNTRVMARPVNHNYFVMYEKNSKKNYTDAEPNDAYVFAKKVPKHADLIATLQNIPDLKKRRGAGMCASDVNLE